MHIAEHLWQMSLLAGLLIVFVLILRMLLRGCSKGYSYGLWFLVLLRLLCPVFIESDYSMQPGFLTGKTAETARKEQPAAPRVPVRETAPADRQNGSLPGENAGAVTAPGQTGMSGDETGHGNTVPGVLNVPSPSEGQSRIQTEDRTADPLEKVWQNMLPWMKGIYAMGTAALLFFFTVQYTGWKRKLKAAVHVRDNIWRSERAGSPFVLGVLRPRIYLSYGLEPETERYILLHEQSHIRHGDPLLRLLGTFALCLHWWNPLVWLGIHLFYQDMEMFCDETAMARADLQERRAYASALLGFAIKQNGPAVLAFGETHTERRIRNILQTKRRGRGITLCVALAALTGGIVFLTVPQGSQGVQGSQEGEQPSADGEQNPQSSTVLALPQQSEELREFVLSEGQAEISAGDRVTLRLVLTEGTRSVYRGQDGAETEEYEGIYELRTLDAQGQLLDSKALANGQGGREMRFYYKDFPWYMEDCNLDGQQDFFLGTKTEDGRSYHYFFTVTAEGKLEYLYDGPMWGDYWPMGADGITNLYLESGLIEGHLELFLYQMNAEYSSHDFYTWSPDFGKYRKSVEFTDVYPEDWDQNAADYLEGDWRVSGIDIWEQEQTRPNERIGEILRYGDGIFQSLDTAGNVRYEGNIRGCSSLTQSGEEFWNTYNVAWLDAYAQDARRILVNLGENADFGNAVYVLDENTMLVYDLWGGTRFWTATRVRQRGEAAQAQEYLQGTWEITGIASVPYEALEQEETEALLGTKLIYDWQNAAHEYAMAGAWETSLPIRGFGCGEDDSANWPSQARLPEGNFRWWNVNLGDGEFFGSQMIPMDENTMWVYYVGTFFEARRTE